jgi:thiol-disulfide isomerase/thioredoxin
MSRLLFLKKGCIRAKFTNKKALFLAIQKQICMFKFLTFYFFSLIALSVTGQNQTENIKKGEWNGFLQLNSTTCLPFDFIVSKKNNGHTFTICNGEERITLNQDSVLNDSLYLSFPLFNSSLVLKIKNKKRITGYWLNMNKGMNYKIPCEFYFIPKKEKENSLLSENFEGKWESTFEPHSAESYKAVGLFNQTKNSIQGTFLTETGDYRYLNGRVTDDNLILSCFDGSHAFLFTGKMEKDSIYGSFYSGKHWQTTWMAKRNDAFQLKNADSLTFLVDTSTFHFELNDLEGKLFTFPNENYKGKITIIQIMGTWCPNCMDETRYFKELKNKYNNQGLEIISIGYEVGSTFEEHAEKISSLQKRLDLNFKFLVGGSANKDLASKHFNMLNQIISFPTAIFIGRDGKIKKIHTGFSGPGTGEYYLQYIKETELLIESLIKED